MSQPGQDNRGDEYKILWIIFLIFAVIAIIWYLCKEYLVSFFIQVKRFELSALSMLLKPFGWGRDIEVAKADFDAFLEVALNPLDLSPEVALYISSTIGQYLRIPACILIAFFCLRLYVRHPIQRFCHQFNVGSLCKSEKILWPQISPVLNLNLVQQELDSGPWAMAMTPMQYCKKNNLIKIHVYKRVEGMSQDYQFKAILNKKKTAVLMSQQLGRPWDGFQSMAPHRRAILAVLIARGSRDSKKAQALVGQYAQSMAKGKLDIEGADALIQQYQETTPVKRLCKQHAYELTLAASLLQFAREDGVVASADFLWVKPIDRSFWYTLNSIGRQTPFIEAGGVFAHWITECAVKRALGVPMVQEAVVATELALEGVLYIPDEAERAQLIQEAEKMYAAQTRS